MIIVLLTAFVVLYIQNIHYLAFNYTQIYM